MDEKIINRTTWMFETSSGWGRVEGRGWEGGGDG